MTDVTWLTRAASTTLGRSVEPLPSAMEALTGIGSWSLDLATWDLVWSDGLYRIYGFDPGGTRPTYGDVQAVVHPADRARVQSMLDEHLADPRDGRTEYRLLMDDGAIKFLVAHATIERDDDGLPSRYLGTVQDVTAVRRAERKTLARNVVTETLRDWTEFNTGAIELLAGMGTAFGWSAGGVWAPDDEAKLECRVTWAGDDAVAAGLAAANASHRFPCGVGLPGRAWQAGAPIVIEELAEVPDFLRAQTASQAGLCSAVAFPAAVASETLAVVEFFSSERCAATDGLVRTLEGVGAELGSFLARHRGDLGGPRLSPRECEVLKLAAEGNSASAIAQQLTISPATAKSHFEHIYAKLGVTDRPAAVAYALRRGLID